MRKAASRLASLIFPGVMCGVGSGVGDGVGVVPELPQLTSGFCSLSQATSVSDRQRRARRSLCMFCACKEKTPPAGGARAV